MNPEIRRLKDMAEGWKGSAAEVRLNQSDAELLGVEVPEGELHATIRGDELYKRARALSDDAAIPEGAEASPNQASNSSLPPNPPAPAPRVPVTPAKPPKV